MIEAGGGLSLAIGMAVSGQTRSATQCSPATVVDWLAAQGGRAITSRRKLADVLGRRPTALADELQRLSIAGVICMATSPRGTLLELVSRPN